MAIRGSIVVSIPACHAGDPGSIPGLGETLFSSLSSLNEIHVANESWRGELGLYVVKVNIAFQSF
jgi:hypothetical protein